MEAVLTETGPVHWHRHAIAGSVQVLAWANNAQPTGTTVVAWHAVALWLAAGIRRLVREQPCVGERECLNPECRLPISRHLDIAVDCAAWPRQLEGRPDMALTKYLRERLAPAVGGFCCPACWRATSPETLPPHQQDA